MPRPQSVGELVAALVDRELVVREGPAGRGRRTGLSLTADGRAAVDRALPLVRVFNAPEAIGVGADEAADLVRLLRRVRTTLEAAEGLADPGASPPPGPGGPLPAGGRRRRPRARANRHTAG